MGSAGSEDPISNLLLSSLSKDTTAAGLTGRFSLAPEPPTTNVRDGMWAQLLLNGNDENSLLQMIIKCPLCSENYNDARVLACFHSYCRKCLESLNNDDRIVCPVCCVETQISPSLGIDGLLVDYGLQNAVQRANSDENSESRKDSPIESEQVLFIYYLCSIFLGQASNL